MSASPNFASTPRASVAQISTANTARDGTGTLVTVMAGVAAGTRIDDLSVVATGTTTAGMIRLFVSYDNGTTNRFLREIPVTAVTPSGTVQAFRAELFDLGLTLPNASALLRASTNNAETFNVHITRAGDF